MLSNTLNTNEIKDAAGAEQEFQRLSQGVRSTEFGLIAEPPAKPHRLRISHLESGAGLKLRRRSVVRFDKTVISDVDNVTPVVVSSYMVTDAPVGALVAQTEIKNVQANLMSFVANTGADTTIKFDNTGNGAKTLLDGGL
jgi:hypothetical protein